MQAAPPSPHAVVQEHALRPRHVSTAQVDPDTQSASAVQSSARPSAFWHSVAVVHAPVVLDRSGATQHTSTLQSDGCWHAWCVQALALHVPLKDESSTQQLPLEQSASWVQLAPFGASELADEPEDELLEVAALTLDDPAELDPLALELLDPCVLELPASAELTVKDDVPQWTTTAPARHERARRP